MATLAEIEIRGIRSFGPEDGDAQRIKFQKPLTLILGENGCGKSTIIECLRYISTHKEPSGKSTFVHDPSLTNKATVKGSIKLSMYDIRNEKVNLSKSLQVSRNKKSVTQKLLDTCITRRDKVTNEKQSISGRCADFTYEVPRLFGVSKAILENVIFCTQEDSHWPLETDMKLKEKFDQIFDSDRYNKCVNKVRDKKKKVRDDAKLVNAELVYLKDNKDKAAEKRRELQIAKRQEQDYNEKIKQCDSDIKPIEEKLKNIYEAEMDAAKIHTKKETKKTELNSAENYHKELKKRIGVEFKGSDEDLKAEIGNFSEKLKERQKSMNDIQENIDGLIAEESKLSRERLFKEKQLGQLQTEEDLYKREVEDRNRRLNKLATELEINVSGYSQSSEDQVQRLFNQAQNKIKEKDEEFSNLQEKCEKENQELQNEILKLHQKYMGIQNDVENKKKSISNNEKELKEIEKKLNEVEQSASKLSRIETQLSEANKKLEELQNSTNVDSLKEEIKNLTKERNRLEERLTEIQSEIDVLQQQAAISAELDLQLAAKATKDSDIRRLTNKHEDTLTNLLGSMPESGFKIAIQSHVDKLRRRVKELTSLQSSKEKQLTELETNRKHIKEKLSEKEEALRTSQEEIYNECESEDFEETLETTAAYLNTLQDNKGVLTSSKYMFNKYLTQFQKHKPCCPVCHRDFERDDDVQKLIEEYTNEVQRLPDKINENSTSLEEKQAKYNRLLTLKPKYSRISELKNQEIPELRSKLETIEVDLKKTRKELEDLKKQIAEPQKDEATCVSIQGDMALLDQLQSDQKRLEREIEKLEIKLGGNRGTKGNLQQMQKEQEDMRKNLKAARDKIETLQTKLNQQNESLQILQATINSLMEERSKIHGGVGQKKQLEERRKALQDLEEVESIDLYGLIESQESAKKNLKDAESNKKTVKTSNDDKINRMRSAVNALHRQYDEIETVQRRVKALADKGISRKLEEVHGTINSLKNQIEEIKRKRDEAVREIDDIKKDLSNQQARERELEDNLKYREKLREANNLREELAQLESKFGSLNYDNLLSKKRQLKSEEEGIVKKKATLLGQLTGLQNHIESLNRDLNSSTYRTADAKFSESFVKAEVLKAIESDLDRYATAMEWAVMKYHSTQMEKVNSFIREYWRKIYQGNDIDYIEIKTDEMTATEKRRNYNYRLVQVKSDVHLDMRNRCSAGQKMLASLIIRMALAETFSGNCGILTLDEPTTNLDRKNIRNLARTLNEVLMAKQDQNNHNFQLIVITHDEEFVKELMEVDAITEYIKIDRTPGGKSRAVLESIMDAAPVLNQHHRNQQEQYDYD